MQNDELIWATINKHFCAFKVKTETQDFCRNEHNVTGLCNRVSCPLANSNYGTIMENKGVCYLYLKTIERAHLPKFLWEKIPLPKNYQKAIEEIDKHMKNVYADHQIHRCKQKLTRIKQALLRMRKMQLQTKPLLVPIKKKTEKREQSREKKAEVAAKLDNSIEEQLLYRLKQGTYGNLYENLTKKSEVEEEKNEEDKEEEEEEESEWEDDEDEDYNEFEGIETGDAEFVEGEDEEEVCEEEEEDIEESSRFKQMHKRPNKQNSAYAEKPGKKSRRLEIEYEYEKECGDTFN